MKRLMPGLLLIVMLLGLPLAGVWLAGKPVGQYLEFPPTTRYVTHAPFSWPHFIGYCLFAGIVAIPFLRRALAGHGSRGEVWESGSLGVSESPTAGHGPRVSRRVGESASRESSIHDPRLTTHAFPLWGCFALLALGISWLLAWTRFDWFAPLQAHTFTPLWVSYVLVVNALTQWRTGRCLMTVRPRYFLALFPASAGFWWFFEYLNRFVQNWYYTGGGAFTAWEYFWYATLPFATVLPAVLSTREFLLSFGVWERFRAWAPVSFPRPRLAAAFALVVAAAALAGIGVRPDALFSILWTAPLLIIVALQAFRGDRHIFSDLPRGDWRFLLSAALAALVCGFFWEMWNSGSLAKWIYTVPYVQRDGVKLFEMPLPGYAGYIPFGLECAVVGAVVDGWMEGRS
ncbi:MAG: hypothetical protein V1809_07635 [Planctomycetota bacterium]